MTGTLVSRNPATNEIVGEVPLTPPQAVAAVAARARAAQPAWQALGLEERARALAPAGAQLIERADELALLMTREMGKPLADAQGEITHAGESLTRLLAELSEALAPETLEDEQTRSKIFYEPHGVCAAITPWNFPLLMPHWLVIPALVAGNTVVLKPSEETPLIAQAYADLLNEFLPTDVLLVVHGADEQGKALVGAQVDVISFTGSREAGKHILRSASDELKRVILELGGKDPLVVLQDAEPQEAAAFAARNGYRNAGQVCVSTERVYVHREVAEQFESELARLTREVTIGPMVNAQQKAHVERQVEQALAAGARVLAGGEGHHDNFFQPTLLGDVTHDMEIMREETFGPVICVQRFSDEGEAIRLANDTPFGLGAVVFGEQKHALQVGRQIEAGMVGINRGCGGVAGSPWVGVKQSGYGFHSGKAGHRQFAVPRVLTASK